MLFAKNEILMKSFISLVTFIFRHSSGGIAPSFIWRLELRVSLISSAANSSAKVSSSHTAGSEIVNLAVEPVYVHDRNGVVAVSVVACGRTM